MVKWQTKEMIGVACSIRKHAQLKIRDPGNDVFFAEIQFTFGLLDGYF